MKQDDFRDFFHLREKRPDKITTQYVIIPDSFSIDDLKISSGKTKKGGYKMISRDAVRILMLSPLYFRLNARQRLNLVREYCLAMNSFSLTTEKKT
ncbi:MAG: hypothetical protein D3908_04745 [Candidatus Electrothrix sp. AUS4]|nr:hypothetical protein [Candidatus Electrothrix sp. AUS4]